jgi:hypothetical protein
VAAPSLSPWTGPALFAVTGCLALAVGLLVYMADRNAGQAALFPAIAALHTGPIFGVIGAWLPSFVHPFAFSLFTAAVLPRTASPAYGGCVAWWAVNIAFEAAQHPQVSGHVAASLQLVFGPTWLTRALSNYFLRGTFDVGDIVAATAGALTAAGVLHLIHCLETRHAH